MPISHETLNLAKKYDDMVTLTIINNDGTNSILGQYYGYNNQ